VRAPTASLRLIDSHAHLDMHQFDEDRNEVLARAAAAGVFLVVTIGTGSPDANSLEHTLGLADIHPAVFAGVGVHPHDARLLTADYWEKLVACFENPKVRLWGEIGLDYYYDFSPREAQREVFVRQLRAARERRVPVAIHCRDAWDDLIGILRQEWRGDTPRGIMHSFTGTQDAARECLDAGFMLSFSGMVSFRKADTLRDLVRLVPADALLVETDSPYLAPVPHRGRRNEPAWVVDVARSVAEARGENFESLAQFTTLNALRLLHLDSFTPVLRNEVCMPE
jgi:TatD DNase family protein